VTEALIALALTFGLSTPQAQVWAWLTERGREFEYVCADEIISAESSWRPDAIGDRDRGNSYGLAQRHSVVHGTPELPWPVEAQMEWFTDYADQRYGDWCAAAIARREKGWW
jgi:hypothetical protein